MNILSTIRLCCCLLVSPPSATLQSIKQASSHSSLLVAAFRTETGARRQRPSSPDVRLAPLALVPTSYSASLLHYNYNQPQFTPLFHGASTSFPSPHHLLRPHQEVIVSSTALKFLPTMPRRSTRNRTTLASGTNDTTNPNNDNEDTTSIEEHNSSSATNNSLKGADKSTTVDGTTAPRKTTKKSTSPKKKAVAAKSDTKKNKKAAVAEAAESTNENDNAPKKRKTKGLSPENVEEDVNTTTPPTSTSSTDELQQPQQEEEEAPKKKAKKAPTHQQWTEITPLIKHWDAAHAMKSTGSYTFTILSWNVAGLRALIKNHPDTLSNLANRYNVDVLCLQETKLQEGHMDDVKLKLREYFEEKLSGYDGYFSYSMEKKGYSGTAMFIKRRKMVKDGEDGNGKKGDDGSKTKKKQVTLGAFFAPTKKEDETTTAPNDEAGEYKSSTGDIAISHLRPLRVETTLGLPVHDGEGRTITAEFPLFHLTNVYVPNSGQNLDRLSYRTQQWDSDFLSKMQQLEKETKKPVLWLGDLNVAHNEKDTWNEGAKHLAKSAGTTAEERASFARQLEAGYVDAFRYLHPEGRGHYTYWSQRAGNRAPNKGLRLDYFICSKELMEDDADGKVRVRDCFMVPEIMGSDHCPIVLEMEIKK